MATLQDAVLRNAEAAGQQEQEAQRLRDGHREGGAAWLRTELEAKNRADLRRLCALLGLPQQRDGTALRKEQLLEAVVDSFSSRSSWGAGSASGGRARPNQLCVSYRDFFLINSVWTSFCGSTTLSLLCTKTSREQNSESALKHLQCLLCVTSRYFVAFFSETVNYSMTSIVVG